MDTSVIRGGPTYFGRKPELSGSQHPGLILRSPLNGLYRETREAVTAPKPTRWKRFEQSSDAYRAVTGMLLLLILVPIVTTANASGSIITALIAGAAATLAMAASRARPWAIRLSWLAWVAVVVAVAIPGDQDEVAGLAAIVVGLMLISAPVVILRRIAKHRIVTATTMWGAIAAYLSLGIALSSIYVTVYAFDPTSFSNVVDGTLGEFNYFSFVTMTTLGYGDIAPTSDLTRAFAVFQTVIGQIFLIVVVARVVSLLGSTERLRPNRDD